MSQAIVQNAGSSLKGGTPTFNQGVFTLVSRYFARRRTQRELSRLDDRILADIGLTRGQIDWAAAEATGTPFQKKTSIWGELLTVMAMAWKRGQMIRSLRSLPPHVLADIGIPHDQIEEAVHRILAQNVAKDEGVKTETVHASPVHGLLRRVEAAAWPFRRGQTHRAPAGQVSRPDEAGDLHLEKAANLNHARDKFA